MLLISGGASNTGGLQIWEGLLLAEGGYDTLVVECLSSNDHHYHIHELIAMKNVVFVHQ